MGVPTLEVCYTSATTGRGNGFKGHVAALGGGGGISQGMRGYVPVMDTLKFTYILFKGECFVKNYCVTHLIRNAFISYDRHNICVINPLYPRSERQFNS
jgi:hypothetical protein